TAHRPPARTANPPAWSPCGPWDSPARDESAGTHGSAYTGPPHPHSSSPTCPGSPPPQALPPQNPTSATTTAPDCARSTHPTGPYTPPAPDPPTHPYAAADQHRRNRCPVAQIGRAHV